MYLVAVVNVICCRVSLLLLQNGPCGEPIDAVKAKKNQIAGCGTHRQARDRDVLGIRPGYAKSLAIRACVANVPDDLGMEDHWVTLSGQGW